MSIPAKKRKHYGNAILMDSDGSLLTGISDKKASWYLKKDLAEEIKNSVNGYDRVIKLKNPAAGKNNNVNRVKLIKNQCVVCGREDQLTLHHVFPLFLRRVLPGNIKNYNHEWCVLTCCDHHSEIEKVNYNIHGPFLKWQGNFLKKVTRVFQFITQWLFILKLGGVKSAYNIYKKEFLKMNPKYLPGGFLE